MYLAPGMCSVVSSTWNLCFFLRTNSLHPEGLNLYVTSPGGTSSSPTEQVRLFLSTSFYDCNQVSTKVQGLALWGKGHRCYCFYPRSDEGFSSKQAKGPMLSFHPVTQYASSNSSHKMIWIKTILNIYFYHLFFFN